MGPRDDLETELGLLDDLAAASAPDVSTPSGHSPIDPELRDRLHGFAEALDEQVARRQYRDADDRIKTFAPSTIHNYVSVLRLCGQRGLDLVDEPSADAINDFMAGQHDDRGLSKSTIGIYQSAISAYVRYHADLGVDPDDVEVWSHTSEPRHDEQDMFTEDEVDALRAACGRPRDRALLELLVFTGQRLTALRTLRRRDVDVQEGVLYLNTDFESEQGGLKNATRRGRKRSLFGARKYVRDWLEYHPDDDPDAWLFVGDPSNPETTMDTPWSKSAIRERLQRIADEAGVDKPVNPHNFRHYFVTVMKRDYELDSDVLRTLLGVAKDSTILDTTYSHVTTDESIRQAEVAVGYRDAPDEGDAPLTPDACPTCGELLEDHWRRCPACDELFGPRLERLEAEADETTDVAVDDAFGGSEPLSAAERKAFREVLDAYGDPVGLADAAKRSSD